MLKFRGIPYIAFGYSSMFSSRKCEIEKIWYLKDGWKFPILLKSRIINSRRRYTDNFLKRIKAHKLGFKILVNIFNDCGKTEEIIEYNIGEELPPSSMLMVHDSNDNYIGNPEDTLHLFNFSELETSASGRVISAGYNPKEKCWCGWSHRAKTCFKIGDKLFQEDFGDDKTLYKEHGSKTIENISEAKQAALNFAAYVS